MELCSYAHRPILVRPDDIPSLAEAERSPTEMPFTGDDFAPQLGHAREIMGELLAGSEMQYSVNGLLSLTPDAQQVLGETAEVEKLWSAAAVWIKEGPGTARLIAEWMTYGCPLLCDPTAPTSPASTRTSGRSGTSARAAPSTSTRSKSLSHCRLALPMNLDSFTWLHFIYNLKDLHVPAPLGVHPVDQLVPPFLFREWNIRLGAVVVAFCLRP